MLTNYFSIFVPMYLANEDIICKLKREILPLEGLKVLPSDVCIDLNFTSLERSFPNGTFPVGCIHEFIADSIENASAGYGFISFLLSKFMKLGGPVLWVSKYRTVFPGALINFGIDPQNIVFVHLSEKKDILFTVSEALKCARISAVICEVHDIDFKQSRRLQLTAEKSRVTGFIFRQGSTFLNTIAAVSRWQINSLPSSVSNGLPGVGFPRWEIDLQKIRNGTPGKWFVELRADGIHDIRENVFAISQQFNLKTG